MDFCTRLISVLATALLLAVEPSPAAEPTALEASPDESGLLVLDLKARYRMIGLATGFSIDRCAIAIVLPGGSGWDMNHMATAREIAGAQVFAAKPGHYRLFMAEGSRGEGAGWRHESISFLESPLPQLSFDIRKGQVSYLGTVKVDVFPPLPRPRTPLIDVALDAEREQKLLAKLAEKAVGSPWRPLLLQAASTEWVTADLAAARARASAPAESLPAVPVMTPESAASLETEREQVAILRDSVMARAPRAPLAGRRPGDRLLWVWAGNKQGLIDTLGRIVVEPEFDEAFNCLDGRGMVSRDGLYGYVDGTGRIVIEPRWQRSFGFKDGLARVVTDIQSGSNRAMGTYAKNSGHHGWIDRDGNVVIPVRFTNATDFSEGFAWVSEDAGNDDSGKWAVIDRSGRLRSAPQFFDRKPEAFSSGLCAVWFGVRDKKSSKQWDPPGFWAKYGYVDTSGTTVIPAQFSNAGTFSEGLAAVAKGDRIGFIDRTGRFAIEPQFEQKDGEPGLPRFSEGLAAVMLDRKFGFIDSTGRFVIEPRFQEASNFREGLAAVRIENRIGFIDRKGQMVIEPQFQDTGLFFHGIAPVAVRPGLWSYIRRDGSYLWNPVPNAGH